MDFIIWTIWFRRYDLDAMRFMTYGSLDHMVLTICYAGCLSLIFMDPNFKFFLLNFLLFVLNHYNCQPNNFFAYGMRHTCIFTFFYLVVV